LSQKFNQLEIVMVSIWIEKAHLVLPIRATMITIETNRQGQLEHCCKIMNLQSKRWL